MLSSVVLHNTTYIVKCVFIDEDQFELCISNGSIAYFAKDSINNIKCSNIDNVQHNQLLKQALLTLDTTKFVYDLSVKAVQLSLDGHVTKNGTIMSLVIKFSLEDEYGEYNAGQIILQESSNSALANISLFMEILAINNQLTRRIQSLELKAHQRDEFQMLAQQAIREKEALERELYAGFLRVLNSKKEHIREQYSQIKELKEKEEKLTKQLNEKIEQEKILRQQLTSNNVLHGKEVSRSLGSPLASSHVRSMETPIRRRNTLSDESVENTVDMLDDLIMEEDDFVL